MLFGKVFGSIVTSLIGEYFVRKKFTTAGLILSLGGLILAVLQISLSATCVGLLIALTGIQITVIAALPMMA